jgi:uncharacterized protein (DUF302 family)
MIARVIQCFSGILIASALAISWAAASDDGIIKIKSAYPMAETIQKLKAGIAGKGIKFFDEIDQAILRRGGFRQPKS